MTGKIFMITAAVMLLAAVCTISGQVNRDSIIYLTEVFYPANANFKTGTTDGVTMTDTSEVRGENTEDGWFSFNVGSIPFWSTIDSVRFYGYVNSAYFPNWSLTPLQLIPGYNTPAEIKAYIEEHSDTANAYAYLTSDSTFTEGWHNYLLGNNARVYLQSSLGSGGVFRVGMDSRDNSPDYFLKWDGWAQQNVPYIEVSYHRRYLLSYDEDFEDFGTGGQVACQDPVHWTTWNHQPCWYEDPEVVSDYSYSPPNSVRISDYNDLVQTYWGNITSGDWGISFRLYIPSNSTGYFQVMAEFLGEPQVSAMECFFDQGGTGRLVIGDTLNFTWQENVWQIVNVSVDLDYGCCSSFRIDNTFLPDWDWTRGGTIPNKLDAINFYSYPFFNNEMYFDNYSFYYAYVPVELTSFRADVKDRSVVLVWETATEINNRGFEIERRAGNQWQKIGFVKGYGTSTVPRSYSFTDYDINSQTSGYRLKQIDFDGTFEYSKVIDICISAPFKFSLEQNYPNPFNPATTIGFSIQNKSNVKLTILNVLGEEVVVLLNEEKEAGYHKVEFRANLPSGVYFYRLQAGDFVQTRKMILLR